MTMLFSQMVRLACDDVTISGMKVGQLCGLLRRKEGGEGAGESVRVRRRRRRRAGTSGGEDAPLLLEDLDEDQVELVDEALLAAQRLLVRARLDDDADDKVADARALVLGEHLPARLDEAVHNLQGDVLGLGVARRVEDGRHALPGVGVLLELGEDGRRLLLLRHEEGEGRASAGSGPWELCM